MFSLENEVIELLGLSVLLTSFSLVGQAYYRPVIRGQAIQSLLIGIIAIALFLFTRKVDYILLALAVISLRTVSITLALEKAIEGRFGFREGMRGVASLLVVDLVLVSVIFGVTSLFVNLAFITVNLGFTFGIIVLLQGLILIMLRRGTIAHIIGYVEEENGIVMAGMFLVSLPILIEASALLDVLGLIVLTYIIIKEKPEHKKIDELTG